jgi:hypothetical protein
MFSIVNDFSIGLTPRNRGERERPVRMFGRRHRVAWSAVTIAVVARHAVGSDRPGPSRPSKTTKRSTPPAFARSIVEMFCAYLVSVRAITWARVSALVHGPPST